MALRRVLRWIPLLALVSCGKSDAPGPSEAQTDSHTPSQSSQIVSGDRVRSPVLESQSLEAASGPADGRRFHALAPESTGVLFVNKLKPQHNLPFLNNGAGVAIGDYDQDGRPDLYLLSTDGPNRLYRQVAPLEFADVTQRAGVDGGAAWSRGATFVDIDNDGDLDLYVCNTEARNLLYINNADGTFSEAARAYGLDYVGASCMAYFADYDRDGDLDAYLVTHRALSFTVPQALSEEIDPPAATARSIPSLRPVTPARLPNGQLAAADPRDWFRAGPRYEIAGQPDVLFRNNGNGSFSDATESAGVFDRGLGLSAAWLDFDADGWLDLYVANDLLTPDRLYRNNGNGTFTESLASMLPHTAWFSMGSDYGDINNDGRFDFLVADMSATTHYRAKMLMGDMSTYRWFLTHEWPRQVMRNALYLNTGTQRFMEIGFLAGLASTDWTWSVRLSDLDNDGWLDAFFTNGTPRDDMNPDLMQIQAPRIAATQGAYAVEEFLRNIPAASNRNLVFRNDGSLQFENVSAAWGLDHDGVSFGAALSDLDRDGDLDIVVNHLNEPAGLYRNDSVEQHAVLVQLRGTQSNRFGVGARVDVETDAASYTRLLLPARGYLSSDEPVVHVGLGDATGIRRLTVHWPQGRSQTFENLACDRLYTVREPAAPAAPVPAEGSAQATLFAVAPEAIGLDFRHRETAFDDYALQPLLPGKLSQLGPGIAVGDVNGDDRDDVFVAGASAQHSALFIATDRNTFEKAAGAGWLQDSVAEDMVPLFFDADADGDLDLYVGRGSVEHGATSHLHDRLYHNDGEGHFTPAADGVIPAVARSTGAVAACDFDADGDLDLFVGSRLRPGQYPVPPASSLLRNDGGHFTDVTAAWCPSLANLGLVTSALWSDANADGGLDLLLTLEWGAVRLFLNRGQQLEDVTAQAGLAQRLGWWNAITSGDLDHDGDIDFVVMNAGLNTKYGAPNDSHPALLYYGDMDGSGTPHLIEAKTEDETRLPIRGRSCSASAMAFIEERFATYHDFASASLSEIYDAQALRQARTLTATNLASGVLLNDGSARFTWRELPRLAQASPGYGVAIRDFNGDGHADVCAVQNLFTREPETGPWRGGVGFLLLGDGSGELRWTAPANSGVVVSGDAKGLAVHDWNQDGWPDLLLTQNDDRLMALGNATVPEHRSIAVRLRGAAANPSAVGARLTFEPQRALQQTFEISAGGGYLSQSSALAFFGCGESVGPFELRVRWPDGKTSTHSVTLDSKTRGRQVTLRHPDHDSEPAG